MNDINEVFICARKIFLIPGLKIKKSGSTIYINDFQWDNIL